MPDNTLGTVWGPDPPAGSATAPLSPAPPSLEPETPAAPPDPVASLTERVNRLTQQLDYLGGTMAKLPELIGSQRQPEKPPAPEVELDWKDADFMSVADAQALLESHEPHRHLNKILNETARTLHKSLVTEIKKRDTIIDGLKSDLDGRFTQQEQSRREAADREALFTRYPHLRETEDLVNLEWARMAQQYQQAPHTFAGYTRDMLIDDLGKRVDARLAAFAARGQTGEGDGSTTPTPAAPARRARLEGSTAARVSAAPLERDPQKRAIAEMDRYIRGR